MLKRPRLTEKSRDKPRTKATEMRYEAVGKPLSPRRSGRWSVSPNTVTSALSHYLQPARERAQRGAAAGEPAAPPLSLSLSLIVSFWRAKSKHIESPCIERCSGNPKCFRCDAIKVGSGPLIRARPRLHLGLLRSFAIDHASTLAAAVSGTPPVSRAMSSSKLGTTIRAQ